MLVRILPSTLPPKPHGVGFRVIRNPKDTEAKEVRVRA